MSLLPTVFKNSAYRFQWSSTFAINWALEIETLVLGWFVLVTTESAFLTSLIAALNYIGTLVCPFSGLIADRINRVKFLTMLRLGKLILAVSLLLLAWLDEVQVWQLFLIAGLSGMLRPSDLVVRNALIADVVERHQLRTALALERSTMDIARILGAALGASMFAKFGLAPVYGAVVGFYLVGVILTNRIYLEAVAATAGSRPLSDFLSGLTYLRQSKDIISVLYLAFLVNLLAFPVTHGLLPILAKNQFGLDEAGLASLVMAFAGGALAGSLLVAVTVRWGRLGLSMVISILSWHGLVLCIALVNNAWVAGFTVAAIGFVHSASMILMSALLLSITSVEFRGRITGIRMMMIYGLPLGLVLAGLAIEQVGIEFTLASYGLVGLAASGLVVLRRTSLVRL